MLTVLDFVSRNKDSRAFWNCRCDCGNVTVVSGKALRRGTTKSCGCLHMWLLKSGTNTRIHGHARKGHFSKEYTAWAGAKTRCGSHSCRGFKNYGGRGIAMCDKWKQSFEAFLKDMGLCPNGMTLDRIDNNKGYQPGNCRWASRKAQNNNKRNNHRICFNGKSMTISEWADSIGIDQRTIWKRIMRGWPMERALNA